MGNFDRQNSKLLVLGKGRGSQRETIDLTPKTRDAICYWLAFRGLASTKDALFVALDLNTPEHPLTDGGIAKIVRTRAKKAGITKPLSPHRIRRSSITAALDAGQSVREVQKLSRHTKLETLMIYDDNRQQRLSHRKFKLFWENHYGSELYYKQYSKPVKPAIAHLFLTE